MRTSLEPFGCDIGRLQWREDAELQILLVEDNPDDAALICHTLTACKPLRFEIDPVQDLASASRCVDGCQYDAMLLDLGLPDSSGVMTFQWACPHTTGCPVIVLSASEDPHLIATAGSYGIHDYLLKDRVARSALPAIIIEAIASHAHAHAQ